MVKIEEGKFYKTRAGKKVGPAERSGYQGGIYPWNVPHDGGFHGYTKEGDSCIFIKQHDLVGEWHECPVRTVTSREIVPGDYGRVKVGSEYGGSTIWVEITEGKDGSLALTADELRSAAMIFSQLAEALDSNEETK